MSKVLVVGLDGFPFTLMRELFSKGHMPFLERLASFGTFKRMNSILPPVSSAAWTSFQTGKNPGGHGVYGFVDRDKETNKMYIPLSRNIKGKVLWDVLGEQGKRSVFINVPVTYPPREINGDLICGFLCPDLEKVSKDGATVNYLKSIRYKIDSDAALIKESKDALLRNIEDVFEKRKTAALHFFGHDWDLFVCHIMETDRLFHFFWTDVISEDSPYYARCVDFVSKVDAFLKELYSHMGEDDVLIVLSDHGFCELKCEIQLNKWLLEKGYLVLKDNHADKEMFDKIDFVKTKAYSLVPGRIYVTTEDCEGFIDVLATELESLKDPDTGTNIIQRVFRKNDIYSGGAFVDAPDLVVLPVNGYDLKGHISPASFKRKGDITGMHTYDDALFLSNLKGFDFTENFNITNITPTIMDLLKIKKPTDLTGRSLIS